MITESVSETGDNTMGESTERGENRYFGNALLGSKRKKIRTHNKEEKGPETRREPG